MVVEIIMPLPFFTSTEDNRRDAIVTFTHDEVRKPGDLVNYCLFRDLQNVSEEVGITPEIAYCRHAAPTNRVSRLSASGMPFPPYR